MRIPGKQGTSDSLAPASYDIFSPGTDWFRVLFFAKNDQKGLKVIMHSTIDSAKKACYDNPRTKERKPPQKEQGSFPPFQEMKRPV